MLARTARAARTTRVSTFGLLRAHTALINRNLTRTMATQYALTDAIKEDHEEMYEYYEKYQKAAGDADAQGRWARQFIWEVARHAVGEELVVYPLMEQHLGEEGKKLADEDRVEHQTVKEQLNMIESLQPGTEKFDGVLTQVMQHLRPHNDGEEQKDLPLLEPKLGEEGSKEAAQHFKRTKQFAPTRTHPSAPNKPPFETVVALMAAPVDKLKDAFSKFPTAEMKQSS